MSRIGNKHIDIPAGVEVKIDGTTVTAKGPVGTLTRTFDSRMGIAICLLYTSDAADEL